MHPPTLHQQRKECINKLEGSEDAKRAFQEQMSDLVRLIFVSIDLI
jgi:hypothetical protein